MVGRSWPGPSRRLACTKPRLLAGEDLSPRPGRGAGRARPRCRARRVASSGRPCRAWRACGRGGRTGRGPWGRRRCARLSRRSRSRALRRASATRRIRSGDESRPKSGKITRGARAETNGGARGQAGDARPGRAAASRPDRVRGRRRHALLAVDRKPKRSRRLRRVENARDRADVTILVDHYEEGLGPPLVDPPSRPRTRP